ncbi:uncharacterized protein YutE (UPF0331/DUF86 family) [Peribacillus deserti]|uniref:Uncharacterized protein YutE (UPF0331/DUF86 family) n=1 Tax=Peribacillus deserti TaxID=673318 RepID=A0ABS2QNG7_9BACI|nr:DUF86 domain-containing protein [Peribacillus deserti]MBM7694711.1 uncharacterized protein YutE (UPF0331/DUF86 family) [Peribacillus deserti]
MYFVDREKIEKTLRFLETQNSLFETLTVSEAMVPGSVSALATERISQTMIDSVLDIGNAMIDGFIMRDPGSFEDIIDILEDERVVTNDMAVSFKGTIPLRKMLIQDYAELSLEALLTGMKTALPAFQKYPASIRSYLINELGPVSAFKSE